MHIAREQARKWIFHVVEHISRTYWLECAFPAVTGEKHERGGLRYAGAAALSTAPAARGAWIVTVIACSAGAWAEPQLESGYLLGSTPSHVSDSHCRTDTCTNISASTAASVLIIV